MFNFILDRAPGLGYFLLQIILILILYLTTEARMDLKLLSQEKFGLNNLYS